MLARQIVAGFLAVVVTGALVLGAVMIFSLHALGTVTDQLDEIVLSLAATQRVDIALSRVERPLSEWAVNADRTAPQRFAAALREAEAGLATCGSAPCHTVSRTPADMAASLRPDVDRVAVEARALFGATPAPTDPTTVRRLHTTHVLVSRARGRLDRMSETLFQRSATLSADARRVRERTSRIGALLAAAVSLAATGGGLLIARRIARPLRELLFGIRRVMAGEWSSRVDVQNDGEIGELAAAFNAMVARVRESREQLEEHNRHLEERVRERTEEVKAKERALRQSEKLASLGLLAAGVAHELNNPLTSIVMNANLVIEEVGESSPLYKELVRIDADAARCKRIIDDLRAFARRPELQEVSSAVADVVGEALGSVRHELEPRGIDVHCQLPAGLPNVMWDPVRMVQVLTNLFVNAAHAMPDGGRLMVRARDEDGHVALEVEDTGPGIPEEHRLRIFDPFFTTKPDGTGLGLSIAHGIVTAHGGRIEVDSRADRDARRTGTTVRIIMPTGGTKS